MRAAKCVEGDGGYATRHRELEHALMEAFAWAGLGEGVDVQCEVFGEFSHLIPKEALDDIPYGGDRWGIVPDFLFGEALKGWSGMLAELKVVSCCKSYYPMGKSTRGVETRAGRVPAEYVRRAREADQKYCGTPEGEVGPVQQHLESFGPVRALVFGAFGEGSPGVHSLLESLAEHRLATKGLTMAWRRGHAGEKAMVKRLLRHRIGVAAVRAQARLLRDRLKAVRHGPGVRRGKVHRAAVARDAFGHLAWTHRHSRASVFSLQRGWKGQLEVEVGT